MVRSAHAGPAASDWSGTAAFSTMALPAAGRKAPMMPLKWRLILALAAVVTAAPAAHAAQPGDLPPRRQYFCTFTSAPADCGFFQQAKAPDRAVLAGTG